MIERVTVDATKCGGVPCIRGMDFPASLVLRMLAMNVSWDEVVQLHPGLEREDIEAVLRYAAALLEGHPRFGLTTWPCLSDSEVGVPEALPSLAPMRPARKGGGMTVSEAGRLGGQSRKKQLGRDGYAEIGRKGVVRRRELSLARKQTERPA
jgi:uncharacterized protein (DUF433 family)